MSVYSGSENELFPGNADSVNPRGPWEADLAHGSIMTPNQLHVSYLHKFRYMMRKVIAESLATGKAVSAQTMGT